MCEFGGNLHKLCTNECDHCFNRSFASHPKAKFWHSEWNKLSPREVAISANKKGWFICPSEECGHTFESIINNVTKIKKPTWCPYCCTIAPKKLCSSEECDSCFDRSFASHPKAEFWHPEWNILTPRDVSISNGNKSWFICPLEECNHTFESRIADVTRADDPTWCPYCAGKKLCSFGECDSCFKRSFASHPRSEFWHPDREWNILTPREISISCNEKGWFICPSEKCGHEFESAIHCITKLYKPTWCPYCCTTAPKICTDECDSCFDRSFASHPKSEFWHPEWNILTPRDVSISNGKKFWFICPSEKCGHVFESCLASVTKLNKPTWCPYCAVPSKKLCSDECDSCFNRSFASHPRAQFWHPEWNNLTPREVVIHSGKKFWFKAECNHEFESVLGSITSKTPTWCPYCKNKTENLLFQWLTDNGFSSDRQIKFDWCRNPETKRHLPFDFLVDNTIIELDGPQHFEQTSNWQSPELTQLSDTHKERMALHRGHPVIRLLQQEVWDTLQSQIIMFEGDIPQLDKWQTILLDLLSTPQPAAIPTLTLISSDALWPGLEGHHIIEITYETRLKFVPLDS